MPKGQEKQQLSSLAQNGGMTLIHIVGLNSRSQRIGFRYIVVEFEAVIGILLETVNTDD